MLLAKEDMFLLGGRLQTLLYDLQFSGINNYSLVYKDNVVSLRKDNDIEEDEYIVCSLSMDLDKGLGVEDLSDVVNNKVSLILYRLINDRYSPKS